MNHLQGWANNPREVERVWSSMPTPFFESPTTEDKDQHNHLTFREMTGDWHDEGPQMIGDCFVAGTKVQMADGSLKSIEDIEAGEEVISHTGNKRRVLDRIAKNYDGELITVETKSHSRTITATPDHRFVSGDHSWIPIGQVDVGDELLIPFGYQGSQTIPYQEAWLKGLYLAEGSISGSNTSPVAKVTFNLGSHETLLIAQTVEAIRVTHKVEPKVYQKTPSNTSVVIHSVEIAKAYKAEFPNNQWTKFVPDYLFDCDRTAKLAVIRGWMDGDGHKSFRDCYGSISFKTQGTSVSFDLAEGMYRLAISCGLKSSFCFRKPRKQSKAAHDVFLYGENADAVYPNTMVKTRQTQLMKQKSLTPLGVRARVKSVKRTQVVNEAVFCLVVEEDHSFIANGYAVHNCVSWGNARLVDYTSVLETYLDLNGKIDAPNYVYEQAATEVIYALSRVEVGGGQLGNNDGSVGAWAAKALTDYGWISRKELDRLGVGGTYSGQRAKEWGRTGLPNSLEPAAKQHTLADMTPVRSWNDLKFHIQNYRVVAVCSNVGFENGPGGVTQRDAKGFARPRGSWMHCMAVVSVCGGSRPGGLLTNQWPPDSVQGPMGDVEIPRCSWWVDADVLDGMLRQGDSYTGTKVKGYPARQLIWRF